MFDEIDKGDDFEQDIYDDINKESEEDSDDSDESDYDPNAYKKSEIESQVKQTELSGQALIDSVTANIDAALDAKQEI